MHAGTQSCEFMAKSNARGAGLQIMELLHIPDLKVFTAVACRAGLVQPEEHLQVN